MTESPPPGSRRLVDGIEKVFYDGFWIKYYAPPDDTLRAKRQLIIALTRRLFNHVEHGINIPGARLERAREIYEAESDPALKRVNGAMLAGSLFNRASDIITKLVEIQELGVDISADNGLLRECGRCLQEALALGRLVLHRSGEEGIDELWGEPLHAFSIPVESYFESRYIKIASTMRDVERIGIALKQHLVPEPDFSETPPLIDRLIEAAYQKLETLQTDDHIFTIWPRFVVACENLQRYRPVGLEQLPIERLRRAEQGIVLITRGCAIINDISRARTPMPKTTQVYIEQLEDFSQPSIFCNSPF